MLVSTQSPSPVKPTLAGANAIALSLFDQVDLVEIDSPDFPGERLVVCRNPLLAEKRARTRRELLAATEVFFDKLARRVAAGRLKNAQKIGEALGRVKNRHKVVKHFECTVAEGAFSYRRKTEAIEREAALDGIYVVRTNARRPTFRRKGLSWVTSASAMLNRLRRASRPIRGRSAS